MKGMYHWGGDGKEMCVWFTFWNLEGIKLVNLGEQGEKRKSYEYTNVIEVAYYKFLLTSLNPFITIKHFSRAI
jgi:hypothetical protein